MDEVLKYGITVYAEKRVGVSKERGILGEKFPPIQSSTPLGLCFDQNRAGRGGWVEILRSFAGAC